MPRYEPTTALGASLQELANEFMDRASGDLPAMVRMALPAARSYLDSAIATVDRDPTQVTDLRDAIIRVARALDVTGEELGGETLGTPETLAGS